MKFKDCKFPGKYTFQKSVRFKILSYMDWFEIPVAIFPYRLSQQSIDRYLDILIEESDFNPESRAFYEKVSNTKISYALFGKIATEYILEHLEDFFHIHDREKIREYYVKAGVRDM